MAKEKHQTGQVALAVESIVQGIDDRPWQYKNLTPGERAMWRELPAKVRAHRYPLIVLDPDLPLLKQLRALQVGPEFSCHCAAKE